jgi:hypothetical protein
MIKWSKDLFLKKPVIRKIILLLAVAGLSFCLSGCLLDITSITVPGSTNIGKVITFTVNASATANGTTYRNGIILQIPSGARVLRVAYYTSVGSSSGFLMEDPGILAGYTPEPGYELYGAVADSGSDQTTEVIFTVWLAVPDGVIPGTYTIKAATGGYDGTNTWVPQYPESGGTPIMDFSGISGKYESDPIAISEGDTTPPDDVTPVVQNGCPLYIYIDDYNESLQGDIAKYRVYMSITSFASTEGASMLDETTSPSVYGNENNHPILSTQLGPGLFYVEVPPGSQFPIRISGLSLMNTTVYFAVTAVDLSDNESNPVVVSTPILCSEDPVKAYDGLIETFYSTVQGAFDDVDLGEGALIMLQALEFPESPNFSQSKSVTVSGGYDCCHSESYQYSVINGTLTISDGEVTAEYLILK